MNELRDLDPQFPHWSNESVRPGNLILFPEFSDIQPFIPPSTAAHRNLVLKMAMKCIERELPEDRGSGSDFCKCGI